MIEKRGAWAHVNSLFGRCKSCDALTVRGICQVCGRAVQCAWCRRVRLPDRTWAHVVYMDSGETTHSICEECSEKTKQEVLCQTM